MPVNDRLFLRLIKFELIIFIAGEMRGCEKTQNSHGTRSLERMREKYGY